jgi:hypothetical protein
MPEHAIDDAGTRACVSLAWQDIILRAFPICVSQCSCELKGCRVSCLFHGYPGEYRIATARLRAAANDLHGAASLSPTGPCTAAVSGSCEAQKSTHGYNHLVHQTSHKRLRCLHRASYERNIQTQDALHDGPSRNPANSIPARIIGLHTGVRMRDLKGGGGAREFFFNARQG